LGPKHYLSPKDFLQDDAQSKYFVQHIGKHEEKIKGDYKKKLSALRDYFDEINAKCNFSKLSKEDLLCKVALDLSFIIVFS